jgi:hypothetical protein
MSEPVNRENRCTLHGMSPDDPRLRNVDPVTGLQPDYVVLCDAERAKGFVRPVRDTYKHVGPQSRYPLRELTAEEHKQYDAFRYVAFEAYPESDSSITGRFWTQDQLDARGKCGTTTTMGRKLAETYARDPGFYGATYCCACRGHFSVDEFVWWPDGTRVGS